MLSCFISLFLRFFPDGNFFFGKRTTNLKKVLRLFPALLLYALSHLFPALAAAPVHDFRPRLAYAVRKDDFPEAVRFYPALDRILDGQYFSLYLRADVAVFEREIGVFHRAVDKP